MALHRTTLRNLHLTTSAGIGAFIYSDALRAAELFELAVQVIAFPGAAVAGLWMWLGPRLTRRLRRDRAWGGPHQ